MNDDLIVQRIRKSFQEMTDEDMDELWLELQRRGIIDAEGRVLKRAPEPPKKVATNGQGKKPARARKTRRRLS